MNNRGIEINADGSYSLKKNRKIKKDFVILDQSITSKDRHSAQCKFRALNCNDLEGE